MMHHAQSLAIPLLAGLSPDEKRHVLECMSIVELPPGAVLVREGDPGDCMYIITSGEIEFLKALGTPEEHLLSVFQAGEFFGEVALLDSQGRRSASARARCPSIVLRMTAADFHQLMHTKPALAFQMSHIISNRLRASSDATIRDLEAKNRALAQAYEELKAAHAQIVEKEKLEKELDVARQIQHSMLPAELPQVKGFTFGAHMRAARQVGGDFYDLFPLDASHIAIVVGDVCDKGVPSALFMALTRSLMRAEALRLEKPTHTLRRVNSLLMDMSTSSLFVTVLYGVLNLSSRRFVYARAGHELPILLRADGSLVDVPLVDGMIMGMFPEIILEETGLDLFPGDKLLLFSDGATDAPNPRQEMFGSERLAQALQRCPESRAQAVCDHLLSSILTHQDHATQFDDITLVAICASH
jgi:serine phosphatase RsbU (regulator of sigma subunit)